MSTTSAYGWNIPDNTDLVKDGALAIRTLGNAIDTSMNTALGTKKAGMVLLNTTSFSGVTSVSLPAGSFTSSYDNYRILIRLTTTANGTITSRLRASGSDASTNNYNTKGVFGGTSAVGAQNDAGTSAWLNYGSNTSSSNISMDLFSPQLTSTTLGTAQIFNASSGNHLLYGLEFTLTTSFDSLSFLVSTGNISGTVRVYGYNQ